MRPSRLHHTRRLRAVTSARRAACSAFPAATGVLPAEGALAPKSDTCEATMLQPKMSPDAKGHATCARVRGVRAAKTMPCVREASWRPKLSSEDPPPLMLHELQVAVAGCRHALHSMTQKRPLKGIHVAANGVA